MAAAQAQIRSGGVNMPAFAVGGNMGMGAGVGQGHTADQQQYFMQQMAQMQAQQQQRQQVQQQMGLNAVNNMGGGMGGGYSQQQQQQQQQQQLQQQQVEQVSSSHGGNGFGGDAAAGGLNNPGNTQQQQQQQMMMGLNSFVQSQSQPPQQNMNSNHGTDGVPGAPAMVPVGLINPSGAPLDDDAQAQQDRLLQQQQLLQQQHQKLLEQQELLRQLQEQQQALQEQQQQAVQLQQQQQQQQQQGMVGGNMGNMTNMAGMTGMTDFPGVPGGIGASNMNPAMMQNQMQQQPMMQNQMQQQQQQQQHQATAGGPPENVSSLMHQQEHTVPIKQPAPSGGRTNRRGSLTFDDLVKGIKSAKAAQKMGMSSTNMNLSVGDIDSNLSSAFEDSLIISVEGSLANSSNSEVKKPAASGGGNVASVPEHRPSQNNNGVPENVTVNPQPGSGPMGESSILRGMAMSDSGMSFSLADAADLLGGSVMQMSYRGFPETKQDDQNK